MVYKLEGNSIFFSIPRTAIIDISVGDVIEIKGFPGAQYVWTEQDADFFENNPEDDVYISVEKINEHLYKATDILLREEDRQY
jgi:hypothetical protein